MAQMMQKALEVAEYCTTCRRHLHQHPELSFQEVETTAFLRAELEKMGVELLPLELKTGVVGIIRGEQGPGPVTALRADIDALPIQEKTGLPHASVQQGVMHACGHDGHTAVLLGAAKLLQEMKGELRGTIKLVFQPGEEGLRGSQQIIDAGAMENPTVEEIVCLHAWPYFKVGEVGAWPGQYMASCDMFHIRIIGQGGHGARPYKAVNPIVAASMAVTALQNVVASEIVTAQQAVVTVCSIHAGSASNVIPDEVELSGTVRCLDAEVRTQLEERIKRTIHGAAATVGCTAEIDYIHGVPSLTNSPAVVERVLEAAKTALGGEKIRELDGPVMGSEDFSRYITPERGGVFFRLGVGQPSGVEGAALHNGAFDFNDEALPTGIAVMVQYILNRHQ